MSIESRLTALQSKVEEILTIAKDGNSRRLWKDKDEDPWSLESRYQNQDSSGGAAVLLSPQAEIRTLELWRSVVAECLGTLCFVFFVCGVSIPWTGHFPPFLSVAFATALAYGALTFRVFPGAHLNPAFTLALTAIKRVSPIRCLLFLTAQAGGAIAGAALLFGLTVPGYQGTLGATTIASHISPYQAFGLELILSFVMTLTFVSDPTNCFPTTAMLLAASLVALPCTGAGLNPVRSLGPAFVMNKWPSHWVFWLGPILGGLMAAYLHTFILRRGKRNKKVRDSPSDGDSLDLPTTELPSTIPDRLLCDRFEPLYGGTRSLYMKPSPILPRPNLHRSQSVYASKRYEFPPKFSDTSAPSSVSNRKTNNTSGNPPIHTNTNTTQSHCQRHFDPETNYEPIYDRKPPRGSEAGGQPSSLLVSGPPSYESNFFKTYDTAKSNHSTSSHGHGGHQSSSSHHHHQNSTSSSNHGSHQHHHHHHREKSDSIVQQQQRERERENQTNRILAQYESAKGLVDVDPKAALKSQLNKSIYYDTAEHNLSRKQNQNHHSHLLENCVEKKLMDTLSCENEKKNQNPPPPPRFRLLLSSDSNGGGNGNGNGSQQQTQSPRYPPSGQSHSDVPPQPPPPGFVVFPTTNDLSRGGGGGGSGGSGGGGSNCGKGSNSLTESNKKPFELLDTNCKKLLDLSNSNPCGQQQSNSDHYSPRLLMAERDSTYSRILEPLLNSKPQQPPSHQIVQQQQQQQQQIQIQQQQGNPQQQQQTMSPSHSHNHNHNHNHNHANGNSCHMSPNDHLTYSYH